MHFILIFSPSTHRQRQLTHKLERLDGNEYEQQTIWNKEKTDLIPK